MIYKVVVNNYAWYVNNLTKTISEHPDMTNEIPIRDICSQQEQNQIREQIKYGGATPVQQPK